MKTITLDELKKVRVGDKIKIVDEKPVNPRCGWADASSIKLYMDAFLGKICTVKRVDKNYDGLPILRLVEDDANYSWTEGMIERVIPKEYCTSGSLFETMGNNNTSKITSGSRKLLSLKTTIKKVIYNKPATIVLWADGTKTTAKCAADETYDPEKGLILCALKKFMKTDEIMDLLEFANVEGNGTVTYKDIINKNKKKG